MQLFLVRHAAADFNASSDHQRPLSEIGKLQAKQSAVYIKQKVQSSDVLIISSDALRTETTALIIQQQLNPCQLSAHSSFYHAQVGAWCDAIMAHQSTEYLILVGHNPTISMLSSYLNAPHAHRFSPACVAHYELEIAADGLKLPAQFKYFFKPNAS